MENAADALKLGFAVFVFILACTLLFRSVALARETATSLITEADKTTYYTYLPEEDTLVSNSHGEANVITRIVNLEDIIPTIYRYSVESYGVTIIDNRNNSGTDMPQIITRFEKETENLCGTWGNSTAVAKDTIIHEINTYVLKPVQAKTISSQEEMLAMFQRIYAQTPRRGPFELWCSMAWKR